MSTLEITVGRPQADEYAPHYGLYISLVQDTQGHDIVATLGDQRRQTLLLLSGRSEADGELRYAPDKWSMKEVLGHMNDTERIMAYRALRISRNDKTPLPGFEQDDYVRDGPFSKRPLSDLIDDYIAVRRATISLFWSYGNNDCGLADGGTSDLQGLPPACLTAAKALGTGAVNTLMNVGCYVSQGSVLIPPALGSYGNASRDLFRGPGITNVDLSITKIFRFRERISAQFRAEAFNVFNHPNFANPQGGPNGYANNDPSAGFGMGCGCITPDVAGSNPVLGSGGPRAIQLGLKILF